MAVKYIARVGIDYPNEKGEYVRVEAGEPIAAFAVKQAPWLLEQGQVEKVEDAADGADAR